jgi:hypothetical protein
MRKITCCLATFILLVSISANAQVTRPQGSKNSLQKVMVSLGAGPVSKRGAVGGFELQGVFKNRMVTSFSFHSISMDSNNEPADYQPGSIGIIIVAIPDSYDPQEMTAYSATIGKFFRVERNVWFTTEAGVSFVNGYEHSFTRQSVEPDGLGGKTSNYNVTRKSVSGAGALLKADLTWSFSSFAGFGFGVFTNVNSVQSSVGGEVKLVLGWMNREKKIKK